MTVGTSAATDDKGDADGRAVLGVLGVLGLRQSTAAPVESAYVPHWHSGWKASTSRTCSSKSVSEQAVSV